MMLRVVVADDHPIVLSGLAAVLRNTAEVELIASCADGDEALQVIQNQRPDVALLDINMPAPSGLEILEIVAREKLPTRIVLLTASLRDHQVRKAVQDGVWGIVLKEMASASLLACLRGVAAGKRWLPDNLVGSALERAEREVQSFAKLTESLSARQLELVMLLAQGLSNKAIARRTGITEATVKIHLHKVYQKVGVENRTELATKVQRHLDL